MLVLEDGEDDIIVVSRYCSNLEVLTCQYLKMAAIAL